MIKNDKQRIVLSEIDELKKKMHIKSFSRLFCCVHDGDKNYVYGMDNLERIFDAYLEEVKRITKEYKLDKDICLKFKREVLEILYDAAMKRKENAWAEYFKNKY